MANFRQLEDEYFDAFMNRSQTDSLVDMMIDQEKLEDEDNELKLLKDIIQTEHKHFMDM